MDAFSRAFYLSHVHKSVNIFCHEPYRLFFPLGIVWTFIGVSHWIWFRLGWTSDYNALFHGLVQTEGFGACFAVGFLMTALPRFVDAQPARWWEVTASLALIVGANLLLVTGHIKEAQLFFVALIVHLLAYALRRFVQRKSNPPAEFIFVLAGFAHALFGAAFIFHPLDGFFRLGERMLEQGMLLSFVLGIGTFLGTRLLGHHSGIQNVNVQSIRAGLAQTIFKTQAIYGLLATCIFLSFWLEAGYSAFAGKLIRALVVTVQLGAIAKLHRPPRRSFVSTYLLWFSFIFTVAGLWLAACYPGNAIAMLHITFVGGFGLMIMMIGMRVTLSHGGFEAVWQKSQFRIGAIGAACILALLFRIASNFFMPNYTTLIAIGALCWDVAIGIWAVTIIPKMSPAHVEK